MSRSLRLFLAAILIALVAVPALAEKKMRPGAFGGRGISKKVGTLSSIEAGEKTVTIKLAGGDTIIAPAGALRVVDLRGGKRKQVVAATLAVGQKVIVKTQSNPKGEVHSVKVKITG